MATCCSEMSLAEFRGSARRRSPNVRVLAAFAEHIGCELASTAFAARVDLDALLAGTSYAAPFGQSPFAFQRGNQFEDRLRRDDYAPLREVLSSEFKGMKAARIVNIRKAGKGPDPMEHRAELTRGLVRQMLEPHPKAPKLIDGAVLKGMIGGVPARFEADALAMHLDGPLLAIEVKSFPVVDGRADADKLGAALDQVAVYVWLTRQLACELGGDATAVSAKALLVTPKNVGLQPVLSYANIEKRVDRFDRMLQALPDAAAQLGRLPKGLTFGAVASGDECDRIAALDRFADKLTPCYGPGCLSSCGLGLYCRARVFRDGAPELLGAEAVRLLPGVESLRRVAELVDGAPPKKDEAAVATLVARAGDLFRALAPSSGKKGKGRSPVARRGGAA